MSKYSEQAKALVAKMSLEEKVSQMLHGAAPVKRLGIPAYNWWNEALHGVARSGVATMFPQAVAMAATFDPGLIFQVAEVIALEGRAKYIQYQAEGDCGIYKGLTFWSPNINIFRDPRWGRGHETFGEDPWLTSRMGVAFIEGLQGKDKENLKAAACAKHFAVHSGPEDERHEFNAVCNDYDLWNTYLPAFEAAVCEAKVESVMGAYNRTLDEPCCGSKRLLQEILREKWGFDGHVTSDCWAIQDFHLYHKITSTPVESVALAVKNGCDLNCGTLFGYCLAAVQEGLLTEEDIDRAVDRLLVTRMRLGILGETSNQKYTDIPYTVLDCPEHRDLNLQVSRRSMVLLKNDGCLPLDLSKLKTIGVIGPNADSRRVLEGNYEGTASEHCTILRGIRERAREQNSDIRVLYAEGCHLYKAKQTDLAWDDDRMAEAVTVAKHSDAVVLCLGLNADIEGEQGDASNEFASGDKMSLNLPGRQQALLEKVRAAAEGKPLILVLVSGSALALGWADEHVNGILQAFYPGSLGGYAVADVLLGNWSPEGKLPVTFYKEDRDLPDFRDYSMENRTYRYFKGEALYPFGFGLSYSRFGLTNLELTKDEISLTVQNTGERVAGQIVQLYASGENRKELFTLCGVQRVYLQPGEEVRLSFPMEAMKKNAFSIRNAAGDLTVAGGNYTLYVGTSQPDPRSVALCGEPLKKEIMVDQDGRIAGL